MMKTQPRFPGRPFASAALVPLVLSTLFMLGACAETKPSSNWVAVANPVVAQRAPQPPPESPPELQLQPRPQPQPQSQSQPQPQRPPVVTAVQLTPGLAADFAAYANDRVFFAFDEAVLSAEARTILDRQADWLGSHPSATIRIEGNADDGGTRDYNLSLGERRADAVRAYLGARGISAARCYTVAYGEAGPSGLPRAQDRGRNARTVVITAAVQ